MSERLSPTLVRRGATSSERGFVIQVEKSQRTRFRLVAQSEDPGISAMQRFCLFFYLSWVFDTPLAVSA